MKHQFDDDFNSIVQLYFLIALLTKFSKCTEIDPYTYVFHFNEEFEYEMNSEMIIHRRIIVLRLLGLIEITKIISGCR